MLEVPPGARTVGRIDVGVPRSDVARAIAELEAALADAERFMTTAGIRGAIADRLSRLRRETKT